MTLRLALLNSRTYIHAPNTKSLVWSPTRFKFVAEDGKGEVSPDIHLQAVIY